MKRIPLILSLALLLLLPAIALYPMLHASAEKDGVDSSTAIQEAAPSEAAPSDSRPIGSLPIGSRPIGSRPIGGRLVGQRRRCPRRSRRRCPRRSRRRQWFYRHR